VGFRLSLRLVATIGSQTVTLPPKRALLVGRSVACDLPVRDPTVSRRHAELELADGGLHLRDLGSTNGTFLNGERLREAIARPGDQVAFGRSVFDVRDDAEAAAGTPREPATGTGLDATILRRVPIAWAADIAAQLADPNGTSLLRIRGDSPAERQERRLALLLDIAKALSRQPEVEHLLAKVVDLIFQVMAVDRAAIVLLGPGGETVSHASRCRRSGADSPWEVPRAMAEQALADRAAVLVECREEGDGKTVAFAREGIESAMCAPLLSSQGEALGLVYLDSGLESRTAPRTSDGLAAPRSFGDEDLEFLSSFAAIVAVAIENSRLVERARREALVLSNFQRYFAPELAEEIAAHPGEIGLGGVKRLAVVLFADIRGFTALSEDLPPDEIALLLNEHFTEMVEVVFEHGGALDKFMGDAMMAIWGAPLARPDDADRAVAAAIGMQRTLAARNRRRAAQGRQQLEVGIGVNLGEVFAGNIGSDRRLEYTVIGDAVNIAARLCAEAGPGEILIADALRAALSAPPPLTALDPVALKGKAQPVPVHRIDWRAGEAVPA
jgi:adenylate cyclase